MVGSHAGSLWCHSGATVGHGIISQLAEQLEDVEFVVTGARFDKTPQTFAHGGTHAGRAPESRSAVERFLTEHDIAAAVFIGAEFPRLGAEICEQKGIPVFLAGATAERRGALRGAFSELGFRPKRTFRHFSRILAATPEALPELAKMGADPDLVEYPGPMAESVDPLPCNESDRAALSAQIAHRPVWCAVRSDVGEIARIEAAHRAARRLSHRLLLIIVPEKIADGPGIHATLNRNGWAVGLRSAGDDPEADSQIYIADTENEEGLWLRLSPITFIGGSLTDKGARIDPFAAAALGSAVISGPRNGRFLASSIRLREAGASRTVETGEGLGEAVTDLLAPERAASMAARGWDITSRGADLITRLAGLVDDALREGAT